MRTFIGIGLVALSISNTAQAKETFHIDTEYVELADKYATDDISSELAQAVIWAESRGNTYAISTDRRNEGLMQLHIWYFTGDLFEPENNIKQGIDYLQSLYNKYQHMPTVLMVYHGEADAVSKGKSGNYSGYATSIMTMATEIEENRRCIANCGTLTEESMSVLMPSPERYSTLKN